MSLYRIYIDEVGNHDMRVRTVTDPNQQFLTLFGIIVEREQMLHVIQPEMDEIKRRYFQHDQGYLGYDKAQLPTTEKPCLIPRSNSQIVSPVVSLGQSGVQRSPK